MTPQQWKAQVGDPIRHRRELLRLSVRGAARLADISEGLWRQIESGRRVYGADLVYTVSPKAATRAAVAGALGWTPDSIDRLLAGQEPVLAEPPAPAGPSYDELAALPGRVAELERHMSALSSLAGGEEALRTVLDLVETVDQLTATVAQQGAELEQLRRASRRAAP